MDGSAKTIFDNLFGSFDEFEKRYPAIVKGLKELKGATAGMGGIAPESARPSKGAIDDYLKQKKDNPSSIGNGIEWLLKRNDYFNPLPGLEKFLGWFNSSGSTSASSTGLTPPAVGAGGRTVNNTNSGNTTINVKTPQEAAEVANARDASFVNQMNNGLDNMAESGGYL